MLGADGGLTEPLLAIAEDDGFEAPPTPCDVRATIEAEKERERGSD